MSDENKIESADEYLKKYHGDTTSHWTNPTAKDLEEHKKAEAAAQQKAKEEKEAESETRGQIGAAVGAYAAHKNLIPRAFKNALSGSPEVYGGTTPAPTATGPRMRVEPSMGPEPLIPHDVAGTHPSIVTQVLQSTHGENQPTGKQGRQGHNMSAQREKWELEQNLKRYPNAPEEIVKFGKEYPLPWDFIVTERTGREIENEANQARDRRNNFNAQAEKDAQLRAERAAHDAAEAQARAARRAEMLGKGVNFAKGALKTGLGAVGGYFTGKDIVDIAPTVWQKGLHPEKYTQEEKNKLLNTAGGLSMMIPTLPTQVLGGALIGKGHQDELNSALDRLAPQRRAR
jgi:hypothetical protein